MPLECGAPFADEVNARFSPNPNILAVTVVTFPPALLKGSPKNSIKRWPRRAADFAWVLQ